jgi:hypothetical protein
MTFTGVPSLAADTLTFSCVGHHASNFARLYQGSIMSAQVVYGDGLRCVGNPLVNCFQFLPANAAVLTAPSATSIPPTPATVSVRGGITAVGTTKGYYFVYRDPVNFCLPWPATFNASNAINVTWFP